MRNERGDGIVPVILAPETEGETLTGSILNENEARGLKYQPPSVNDLEYAKLNSEMLTILKRYMDKSRMSAEHIAVLERQEEEIETDSEIDSDHSESSSVGDESDVDAIFVEACSDSEDEEESSVTCDLTLCDVSSESFDTISDTEFKK